MHCDLCITHYAFIIMHYVYSMYVLCNMEYVQCITHDSLLIISCFSTGSSWFPMVDHGYVRFIMIQHGSSWFIMVHHRFTLVHHRFTLVHHRFTLVHHRFQIGSMLDMVIFGSIPNCMILIHNIRIQNS
jgi:hypothetical protein